jgi:small G protein signaling modulator 3
MTEESRDGPGRSSPQISDTSSRSNKTKSRNRPRKSPSIASSTLSREPDPSLTSFPSLSFDPHLKGNEGLGLAEPVQPNRTVSQKARDRKATLKGLTSASPPLTERNALFDDSPRTSLDVPGALHLANDDHVERLIARSGAVKLVRQFAQDLAQRDAEISALRVRADERERELKKMLREVEVSSAEIERRLQRLESPDEKTEDDKRGVANRASHLSRKPANSINGMMHEAMSEGVGNNGADVVSGDQADLAATIKPIKPDVEAKSRKSTGESTRNSGMSVKGWQGHVWGSTTNSRNTSTSSSIMSQGAEDADATTKPRQPSSNTSRRKGLTNLFQAPNQSSSTSYFIGGAKVNRSGKAPSTDAASVHSKQSTRSMTSWTMKLFAGNPQAGKEAREGAETVGPRRRSSSLGQGGIARKTSVTAAESAMAALAKNASHTATTHTSEALPTVQSAGTVRGPGQNARRVPASGNMSSESPDHARSSSNLEDIGPVEMDAILPTESKPPTMMQTFNKYQTEGLLTDRFGFIYDQRQRKRRRDTMSSSKKGNPLSGLESLANYRRDSDVEEDIRISTLHGKADGMTSPTKRPTTPASRDEQADSAVPKKWQDYLRISSLTRPTELLLHTPSAGAIVTVNTADVTATITPPRTQSTSISVSARKVLPTASSAAEPNLSLATASIAESSTIETGTDPISPSGDRSSVNTLPTNQEPVKLLLDRLTELHDSLQAEKETKWNEFLRKVRAERSSSTTADRPSKVSNAPEAEIVNGELIGISTLGRPNKINRHKYSQFKTLVLQGIPVSLRPKIWSECSGANARRSPGYFDDLLSQCESGEDLDEDIVSQINADIGRTLTDNTFFRHGPGVRRLKTLLLAYSLHNPNVGYCQGMNLITASLLLIMPTPEDAFWILVAIIENILPSGYFDKGLLVSRADQIVLRCYVGEILPKLGAQFEDLGVELEACSFMWFLSLFTGCLSAEALYRVWDVVLCLNSSDTPPGELSGGGEQPKTLLKSPLGPKSHPGTSSPFLFQLCLALLKLNEPQLLALDSPAAVYSYVNHNMTNHAISIDGLISASEALKKLVKREDVLTMRAKAVEQICG